MNEKFGFLSNFKGIRVIPRQRKPPSQGELTDNPHLLNYEPQLTDDESDGDEAIKSKDPAVVNRIFQSSSSSLQTENDPDRTHCSEPGKMDNNNYQEDKSPELFNSDDLKTNPSSQSPSKRDTVIGSFSDEELCSKMSQVNVAVPAVVEAKVVRYVGRNTDAQADTIIGSFDSDSSDDEEQVKLSDKLRETVIRSSSSDMSSGDESLRKNPPSKPSLPDTIIGFSEMSSVQQFPFPIPRVQKPQPRPRQTSLRDTVIGFTESMVLSSVQEEQHAEQSEEFTKVSDNLNDSVISVESVESEYDEVISILDSDEEERAISILNNEDEPPLAFSDSFRNCSSINSSKTRTETNSKTVTRSGTGEESETTLNKFFNNPPSIRTPECVVTHSMIRGQKKDDGFIQTANAQYNVSLNRHLDESESSELLLPEHEPVLHESIEIPETDASDNEEAVIDESLHQALPTPSDLVASEEISLETVKSIQSSTESPLSSTVIGNINFSASININLKISMRESSDSSSSESGSSSSNSSQPPPPQRKQESMKKPENVQRKATPKSCPPKKNANSTLKENQAAQPGTTKKTPVACASPSLLRNPWVSDFEPSSPRTPVHHEEPEGIIDEGLQAILDSLYGDTWKTPQLLRSCESKTFRKNLRKSIHANNFETFVKNLPADNLESTRIGSDSDKKREKIEPKSSVKKKMDFITPTRLDNPKPSALPSSKKKPSSTLKKTPAYNSSSDSETETPVTRKPKKVVPKTPVEICREICDSDTTSEGSSSDSDQDVDDTWNASSDGEYADESERIRKSLIARKSRKHEEIIFVPSTTEDKRKKLYELFDRSEFKKPLGMPGTPKPITKKKLFSHDHFDDDEVEKAPEDDEVKENVEPPTSLREVFFRSPFPVSKIPEKKVLKTPTKTTPGKKTPKANIMTPNKFKPLKINNFQQYSFLKSLNSEAIVSLCDPEALYYRNNYKSKKEELTAKLFTLYNEKVFDGELKDVPVKWNKKLTTTAGICRNRRRNGVTNSVIELSEKVLTSADRLRCTLIHEMCHAATWILQGEAGGHGEIWKRWTAKAKAVFPELPKIGVCHNYVIEYRFTYLCINCKAKYQTHSKSKKVEMIQCSICRGDIELFLNKKNKDGEVVMTPVSKNVKGFAKFVQLNYKTVKKPEITHKEVMQILSAQFSSLSVEEKQNL